jgi:hypothetical protein
LINKNCPSILSRRDAGHGIHHPIYGVKLKEKSDSVELECHRLFAGVSAADQYDSAEAFLIEKLTAPATSSRVEATGRRAIRMGD